MSTLKDNEIRDRLHPESRGQIRMSFRIDLQDQGLASHLAGQLLNFWRGRAAGAAPSGPKVDQNWHLGGGDNFIE